jgi:hypothetical protein
MLHSKQAKAPEDGVKATPHHRVAPEEAEMKDMEAFVSLRALKFGLLTNREA